MNSALVVEQALRQTSRKYQLIRLSILVVGVVILALLTAPRAAALNGRHGERPPRPDLPNPIMAARLQAAHRLGAGKPAGAPSMIQLGTTGTQPVVIILVENKNAGVTFNANVATAASWSPRLTQLSQYYNEVSGGLLRLTPATETSGTNDGVIGPVEVASLLPTWDGGADPTGAQGDQIAMDAIRAANGYINFANFDTNRDGTVTPNELHIVLYIAGYEMAFDPINSPLPRTWAHTRPSATGFQQIGLVPATDSDSEVLTSYIMLGASFFNMLMPTQSPQATVGGLTHEIGHDLGLPDTSDADGAANGGWAGLGGFCLMAGGYWGGGDGSMPSHICGPLKSYLFWTRDTVLQMPMKTDQVLTLPADIGNPGSNAIVRLNVLNSTEFFIIENRQYTGYDLGMGAQVNAPGTLGGLAIYHCDGAILNDPLRWSVNSLNINPSDAGIQLIEADGANALLNPLGTGSDRSLFRLGNNTTLNQMTIPNTNLKSGIPSQVDVFNIGPSGQTMTFTCGSSVPRVGFAQSQLSIIESAPRLDVVVNLNKKSENLATVNYSVTGGTATNGLDYTNAQGGVLATGTLNFYPGETSKYFTLKIINDAIVEANETIQLVLSSPTYSVLDNFNTRQTITIFDNDNPYLNLASPNGGESLIRGKYFTVAWDTNVAAAGNKVSFDLYQNGNFYRQLSASVTDVNGRNSTSTLLRIPGDVPVGYHYRLAATSLVVPSISDQSDNDFAILDGNLKVQSLTINNGAATATSRRVTLNNLTSSTANFYMASELASFGDGQWMAYSKAPQFTLTAGDGLKRVYFKVKNTAGQETAAVSDTIQLAEARLAPVIKPIAAVSALPYQTFTGPVPVLLEGVTPVMWSLVEGPSGMRINTATGVVTWDKPLVGANPYQITLRASNSIGSTDLSWVLQVVTGDLKTALNDTLDWNTPALTSWCFQKAVTHDGSSAARSGAIGNSQRSVLTTTVNGPGFLTFWWKVSSEPGWDKLNFTIAGEVKAEISGNQDWELRSYTIPEGTFTLEWVYSKNANTAMGSDAGYLDQITWAPQVHVSDFNRPGYQVMSLKPGVQIYTDRATTVRSSAASPLSEILNTQIFIKTPDADRTQGGSTPLSFTVDQPVTALLALDARLPQPKWALNWQPLNLTLETSEASMKLYAYRFPAGRVTLGGNRTDGVTGTYRMYSVILIPATPVTIAGLSKPAYPVLTLHDQTAVFVDATAVFNQPLSPLFLDRTLIRTMNSDRNSAGNAFLSFDAGQPVSVLLAMDGRVSAPPSWAANWQALPDRLNTSTSSRKLFIKRFPAGRVTLGGNVDPGQTTTNNMYSVLVMPTN